LADGCADASDEHDDAVADALLALDDDNGPLDVTADDASERADEPPDDDDTPRNVDGSPRAPGGGFGPTAGPDGEPDDGPAHVAVVVALCDAACAFDTVALTTAVCAGLLDPSDTSPSNRERFTTAYANVLTARRNATRCCDAAEQHTDAFAGVYAGTYPKRYDARNAVRNASRRVDAVYALVVANNRVTVNNAADVVGVPVDEHDTPPTVDNVAVRATVLAENAAADAETAAAACSGAFFDVRGRNVLQRLAWTTDRACVASHHANDAVCPWSERPNTALALRARAADKRAHDARCVAVALAACASDTVTLRDVLTHVDADVDVATADVATADKTYTDATAAFDALDTKTATAGKTAWVASCVLSENRAAEKRVRAVWASLCDVVCGLVDHADDGDGPVSFVPVDKR
jgi:hypothetical protein